MDKFHVATSLTFDQPTSFEQDPENFRALHKYSLELPPEPKGI